MTDCLYLDIWTPRNLKKNANIPVMVWSYGGGFMIGTSATYDFTNFIKRSSDMGSPVIVVAINYRVNSFGFGYGPTHLSKGAANNGLLDVKAAIQWTYGNIASFGGDRSRITAFGASAGGAASALMSIISSPPPIKAYIINSGRTGANPLARTEVGFPDIFPLLLRKTGCKAESDNNWSSSANSTAFECLRGVNAQSLLHATVQIKAMPQFNAGFPWNPSIDGSVIKDSPHRLLSKGLYRKVPVLAG
jgi:acetylcholinesterase